MYLETPVVNRLPGKRTGSANVTQVLAKQVLFELDCEERTYRRDDWFPKVRRN